MTYTFTNVTSVNNFPTTQNVTIVGTLGSANVAITNTPPVSQSGTWWVNVNTFPTTQNVLVTNTPGNQNVTVTNNANVAITNTPPVSQSGTWWVNVNTFPTTQNVLVTNNANVTVTNMPVVQNVTVINNANVTVTNIPATQNVLVTNTPSNQNVTVTNNANVTVTNIPATQNVLVTNGGAATPFYVEYANTIQQDALSRLKTSVIQDQIWYTPTVDKDGDLRFTELFTSNVVTATVSVTRNSANIQISSTTGLNAGSVVTDGPGVPYSPPTYVVSIPSGGNIQLNQNVNVTSGTVLTFNNNKTIAIATSNQNSVSNLYVSSTLGFNQNDVMMNSVLGTANVFPYNTFVISVANATVLTLNQNVSVTAGDTITGETATSYFNYNTGDINMTPGVTADGSAIRQSRITNRIIPGVSHTIYQTVNFNGSDVNTVKKFGLYNDKSGVYWQLSGGDSLSAVVRRTLADGSTHEDVVTRANFNGDKLDGTGPSGYNITTSQNVAITSWASTVVNPSLTGGYLVTYNVNSGQGNTFAIGTNITVTNVTPSSYNGTFSVSNYGTSNVTVAYPTYPGVFSSVTNGNMLQTQYHKYYTWWIEFIGGRTGRVRFGMGTAVGPVILHTAGYSGQLSTTFITSATLPVRWEIYNTSNLSSTTGMLIDGHTFNVEAGSTINPGLSVAATNIGYTLDSTLRPILGFGLRPLAPYNSADLQLKTINLTDLSNRNITGGTVSSGAYYWALIWNPTITGVIPAPVNSGKASRYWAYTPANGITPNTGYIVDNGYFSSGITSSTETITNFLNMGQDVRGFNPDQSVLCVQQIAAGTVSGNVIAAINWVEVL